MQRSWWVIKVIIELSVRRTILRMTKNGKKKADPLVILAHILQQIKFEYIFLFLGIVVFKGLLCCTFLRNRTHAYYFARLHQSALFQYKFLKTLKEAALNRFKMYFACQLGSASWTICYRSWTFPQIPHPPRLMPFHNHPQTKSIQRKNHHRKKQSRYL